VDEEGTSQNQLTINTKAANPLAATFLPKFNTRRGITMKLFFDFEMSGLHQHTTPISLGVVAANGKQFYCEMTDYDQSQVDEWIQTNVIDNLLLKEEEDCVRQLGDYTYCKGTFETMKKEFQLWIAQFKHVELWSDCISYDGVLMNEMLGGAMNLPKNVDYIFYDICTLFKMFGIDPDISRESFIDKPIEGDKHNAIYDARVIEACYDKLNRNRTLYSLNL
jgi:hypothetical protein